jgi:hypothetical protein
MSPSEIYELFEVNPSTPFRLTLASGDTVVVDNPRHTLIEPLVLYVGQSEDARARVSTRVKMVSIPNITMIEKIDPRRPNGRRSRTR